MRRVPPTFMPARPAAKPGIKCVASSVVDSVPDLLEESKIVPSVRKPVYVAENLPPEARAVPLPGVTSQMRTPLAIDCHAGSVSENGNGVPLKTGPLSMDGGGGGGTGGGSPYASARNSA